MNINQIDSYSVVTLHPQDYFFAGVISGFISRATVQPLDVLKIRFQVEPIKKLENTSAKYSGLVQSFKKITHEEGITAFWKGHLPAQAQAMTFTAVQFFSYEIFTRKFMEIHNILNPSAERLPSFASFINGCLAGSCAAIVTQPLDVLRTRFIAQGAERVYNNLIDGIVNIAKSEGIGGFFRGLSPTLLLIAPQTGLQFGFYNMFTSTLHIKAGFETLVSGSLSGIFAKVAVYPLDMAKKRMQVQGFEKARISFGKMHVSNGLRECISVTVKEEGIMALFKGLKPSLIKSCISVGVRFAIYEQMCFVLMSYRSSETANKLSDPKP